MPLRLKLIEERLHGDQRIGPQFEQPDPCVLTDALVRDDPRHEQDLQVPAHSRLGHAGRVGEFAGAMRAAAEKLHHAASSWVGERLEHIHYRLIVHYSVNHVKRQCMSVHPMAVRPTWGLGQLAPRDPRLAPNSGREPAVGGAPAGTFGADDIGHVLPGDHRAGRVPSRRYAAAGESCRSDCRGRRWIVLADLPLLKEFACEVAGGGPEWFRGGAGLDRD